jgi:hypothetical protein
MATCNPLYWFIPTEDGSEPKIVDVGDDDDDDLGRAAFSDVDLRRAPAYQLPALPDTSYAAPAYPLPARPSSGPCPVAYIRRPTTPSPAAPRPPTPRPTTPVPASPDSDKDTNARKQRTGMFNSSPGVASLCAVHKLCKALTTGRCDRCNRVACHYHRALMPADDNMRHFVCAVCAPRFA